MLTVLLFETEHSYDDVIKWIFILGWELKHSHARSQNKAMIKVF